MIEKIRDNILSLSRNDPLVVAIDGVDASGKTHFARELYKSLLLKHRNVLLASVDDFHNPKAIRYSRGSDSAAGFYYDSFNYAQLQELLLEPFKKLQPVQLEYFDCDADDLVAVKEVDVFADTILLLEGIFLHRPELVDYWDYSIFLKVDFDVALQRNINRERDKHRIGNKNTIIARYKKRYQPGQQLYIKEANPEEQADVVIDNSDFTNPLIVRGDLN